MYTDTQVATALATVNEKIALQSYSQALKETYDLADYCGCFEIGCLLLFRFALMSWNNNAGAVNAFTTRGLNNIIKRINAL